MRYAAFDGGTIVELDSNGDRIADFQIELDDFVALTFADFRGLETDASGRGGPTKTSTTTLQTSTESQHEKWRGDDPMMVANDSGTMSADSLIYYG